MCVLHSYCIVMVVGAPRWHVSWLNCAAKWRRKVRGRKEGKWWREMSKKICRGREAVLEGGGQKRMWKICTLFWAERKVGGKTGVKHGELERESTRRKQQKSPWSGKVTSYSMATPHRQAAEKNTIKPKQPFSQREASHSQSEEVVSSVCLVFFSHPRCESQTYDDLNVAQESEVSDKRSLSLVNYLTKTTTPGWKINGLKFNWNECVRDTTNHSSPSLRTKRRMSCLIGKLLVHIEFNHIPGV